MKLDRVAEDIFIMVSELYAQVTASVILTADGAIMVDTLPFPSETRQVLAFVESRLGPNAVRYVVTTHHHADHVYGAFLFEGAEVVAQQRCRELLETAGQTALERAKRDTPELAEVELRLPQITFDEQLDLHLGHRHLTLLHTPGHTADALCAFVQDEKVLIAGDTMMPVPHVVRGNWRELISSLERIKELKPSFVVQGHGEVLLRGEVDENIDSSISYLYCIAEKVQAMVQAGEPQQRLRELDIESCGKSRIPLDGLVSKLHLNNLVALYRAFSAAEDDPAEEEQATEG